MESAHHFLAVAFDRDAFDRAGIGPVLCHHRYVVAGLGGEAPDDFGGHHVMEC
jgi:hypothetical protein